MATVVGYWLSNILGILMMQWGAMDTFLSETSRNPQQDLWWGLGGSTLYTIVIIALMYFHIIQVPADVMANLGEH